ncbi:MAG: TRAP transporter large permease [Pseudomonadota bacterium]
MFAALFAILLTGFPVAFAIGGTGLAFALIGAATGAFDLIYLAAMPQRIFGTMTNDVLLAVPLFVFMGVMLERSKVAETLLLSMGRLFGTLRGGLGISVTVVGALLAASTGIVGATVVTMGLLSLPTMLQRNYDPRLACGAICAAGTLGQIIPPSIVLVLLGDVMASAYAKSQMDRGIFAPETVSVGELFAGALIPGLMLVALYIGYQIAVAVLNPKASPPIPMEELASADGPPVWKVLLEALLPPVLLIVAVLGSILAGIATPTESAAVGAIGATMLAGLRLTERNPWPIYLAALALAGLLLLAGVFDLRVTRTTIPLADQLAIYAAFALSAVLAWGIAVSLWRAHGAMVLGSVVRSTMEIASVVFLIVIGAQLFSLVFVGFHGDDMVHRLLEDLPGGVFGAMMIVMAVMFVMGFFLDFIEITLIVVPLVAPVLLSMGLDPVWLGVMIAMNLQTSFLTPPFGFALFYLRGVAPKTVRTTDIYRGIVPFVLIQLLALAILAMLPGLATWLPARIFG